MATAPQRGGLYTTINPASSLSEAYKTLRTNIRYSSTEKIYKVLLITSASKGEGKSTTAANLAVTYSQEGHKVLLLEGNLRDPSLKTMFPNVKSVGLTDVLTGQRHLSDCISATDVPNLNVLLAGTHTPNPSELIGSERMKIMLNELSQIYDVIIIDSPPALPLADAQILGTLSDGVVLVVGAGKSSKADVKRVKSNMEHVHAHVVGAVLNQT
ncbi:CpsD/CapB family tyrosine-protein kinase [Paenibacillus lemnae]|uniref:non-specific protein-tyrosine kinase n=1 Tax=Paenibacillus lemnae TaxID=1330551 RepID=A0A848MBM6_PAELE|nr:CpsD/CapB family tyrosine-protein kinase [Paenibacillus lemnae]NMO97560.1 CpsD/CapB family tyrosine-protein kinase [Paenibacillus lemnae]